MKYIINIEFPLSGQQKTRIVVAGAAAALLVAGAAYAALPGFTGGEQLTATKMNAVVDRVNKLSPAGSILATAGSRCPDGTLPMDGASVSRITYADLYAAIGDVYGAATPPYGGGTPSNFILPNAQGVFLRGIGSQTVQGVSYTASAQGASQRDGLQNFTGKMGWADAAGGLTALVGDNALFLESGASLLALARGNVASSGGRPAEVTFDPSRVARTASETRPVNISVRYCIWN